MAQTNSNELPKNAIGAHGLLIKEFYKKFGKEALPIIEDVLGRQGTAQGLEVKQKLSDTKLSTVANFLIKTCDPALIKVISLSDEKFHFQGTKCPFGLENTARELCEAVMAIDREYFFTVTAGKTKLEILKTVAAGDPFCDTIFTIDDP